MIVLLGTKVPMVKKLFLKYIQSSVSYAANQTLLLLLAAPAEDLEFFTSASVTFFLFFFSILFYWLFGSFPWCSLITFTSPSSQVYPPFLETPPKRNKLLRLIRVALILTRAYIFKFPVAKPLRKTTHTHTHTHLTLNKTRKPLYKALQLQTVKFRFNFRRSWTESQA